MSSNNRRWIIITILVVALLLLGQIVFQIRDSGFLQGKMVKIASKSHWRLLNSGQSLVIESDNLNNIWNDSIQFMIVANHKLLSDNTVLPEEYNYRNSIILFPQSNEIKFNNNNHYRDWIIINDTTQMLNFLLDSNVALEVFKVKKNIFGQFEIKK